MQRTPSSETKAHCASSRSYTARLSFRPGLPSFVPRERRGRSVLPHCLFSSSRMSAFSARSITTSSSRLTWLIRLRACSSLSLRRALAVKCTAKRSSDSGSTRGRDPVGAPSKPRPRCSPFGDSGCTRSGTSGFGEIRPRERRASALSRGRTRRNSIALGSSVHVRVSAKNARLLNERRNRNAAPATTRQTKSTGQCRFHAPLSVRISGRPGQRNDGALSLPRSPAIVWPNAAANCLPTHEHVRRALFIRFVGSARNRRACCRARTTWSNRQARRTRAPCGAKVFGDF